jgi:uncharacterized protein
MVTEDYVRRIFKGLEEGNGASFFEHVNDDVDWTVEGTHPLAGHYKSKADVVAGTFAKLDKVLPHGAQLIVELLVVKDDQAVVELHSLATAKNGFRFDNRYAGSSTSLATPSTKRGPISIQRWSRVCSRNTRSHRRASAAFILMTQ